MAVIYVNNFDNIRPNRLLLLSEALPAYDRPTLVTPPPQIAYCGPMYEGASTTPSNGTFVTQPVGQAVFNQPGTGVTVTLKNNAYAGQSKTLYVTFPQKGDLVLRGKVLTAELIFDTPMADDLPTTSSSDGWAVALNFKTGDQTDDHINNGVIGAMCHFSDKGTVKLHGTDNPGAGDNLKTYAQYGASPATEFCLTVELIINQSATPVISGTGSLRYGD